MVESDKTERIRPRYLNWKCIDNFDKVSDEKIFYDGAVHLNELQRRRAKREFAQLNAKYTKIINDFVEEISGEQKTHLTIAGGNYTFFFVLPQVISWVRKKYPFLGVHIQLFERGGSAALNEQNADIVLTSESNDLRLSDEIAYDAGYHKTRFNIMDIVFFAASRSALHTFGDSSNVLKMHNTLFSRLYATHSSEVEKVRLYSVIPRVGVIPKVLVDQYFLEYLLMRDDVGIGYLYSSMNVRNDVIVIREECIEKFKRFVIVKNSLKRRYSSIGRRLLKTLQYKEGAK